MRLYDSGAFHLRSDSSPGFANWQALDELCPTLYAKNQDEIEEKLVFDSESPQDLDVTLVKPEKRTFFDEVEDAIFENINADAGEDKGAALRAKHTKQHRIMRKKQE